MDDAPVWTDLRTFDGRPWRGVLDLVAGGFPCQDLSLAGKGAGLDGARSGLWWEFVRVIREVRPAYVFVENVRALVVRGLGRVLGSLAELGFDAEWDVFSSAEGGAPHLRERLFLLARALPDSDRDLLRQLAERSKRKGGGKREAKRGNAEPRDVGAHMAHTARVRRGEGVGASNAPRRPVALLGGHALAEPLRSGRRPVGQFRGRESDAPGGGRILADADGLRELAGARLAQGRGRPRDRGEPVAHPHGGGGHGLHGEQGRRVAPDPRGSGGGTEGLPDRPPGPDDLEAWRSALAIDPSVEPSVRRVAHGLAAGVDRSVRRDRLRLLGNGVDPAVAALAFRTLSNRLGGQA